MHSIHRATTQVAILSVVLAIMVFPTMGHKHKNLGLQVTCGSSWNSTNSTASGYGNDQPFDDSQLVEQIQIVKTDREDLVSQLLIECVDAGVIYNCQNCHGFLGERVISFLIIQYSLSRK